MFIFFSYTLALLGPDLDVPQSLFVPVKIRPTILGCVYFKWVCSRFDRAQSNQNQVGVPGQEPVPQPPVLPPCVLERPVAPHVPYVREARLPPQQRRHDAVRRLAPPARVVQRRSAVVVLHEGAHGHLLQQKRRDGRGTPPARRVEQAVPVPAAGGEVPAGAVEGPEGGRVRGPDGREGVVGVPGDLRRRGGRELRGAGRRRRPLRGVGREQGRLDEVVRADVVVDREGLARGQGQRRGGGRPGGPRAPLDGPLVGRGQGARGRARVEVAGGGGGRGRRREQLEGPAQREGTPLARREVRARPLAFLRGRRRRRPGVAQALANEGARERGVDQRGLGHDRARAPTLLRVRRGGGHVVGRRHDEGAGGVPGAGACGGGVHAGDSGDSRSESKVFVCVARLSPV